MTKKIVLGDIIAALFIILEIVILNLLMEKIGTIVYILLDILLIAIIFFTANYFINKSGNTKTIIINAIVLVLLYIIINGVYIKTPYGIEANKTLNEISIPEAEVGNDGSDIEITFSDADISSQLIIYGFYLVVAIAGGKVGTRKEKKIVHR